MSTSPSKPVVRELVVVEGLHDRQAVERAVAADVWVLGGDRVAHQTLSELRRACASRGVIVFTDPDGAGERIRRRVADAVPGSRHAFLTREQARSAHGIGVEHAAPDDIAAALLAARGGPDAQTPARQASPSAVFTQADLESAGLVGHPGAAAARQRVGDRLGIGTGNAKAFLRKLNTLYVTRSEWEEATQQE